MNLNKKPDQNLTQDELAERWRISPRTLEKWRHLGTGVQHLKIGGRVIYRLLDVEEHERRRQRPKSSPSASEAGS